MSTYAIALIELPIEIKEDMTVVHLTDRIEIKCVPCPIDQIPSKKPDFYVSTKMNEYVTQFFAKNTDCSEDNQNMITPVENTTAINSSLLTVLNPVIETKIDTISSKVILRKDRSVTTFKNYNTKHVKNRTLRSHREIS